VSPGKSDAQPPVPTPEPVAAPTLDGLAADVAALRLRVAQLESRLGLATDQTLLDLQPAEALALLGGASARLETLMADAKAQRGQR